MENIPVYLINLDTDKDRLEFMDDQFKDLGVNYERFPAIRGTNLPDWLKPYFLDETGAIASRLTAGEVGCYASHLAVMKCVADDGQPALIFEDDVQIKPEFSSLIGEFLSSRKSCDILRLSCGRKAGLSSTKVRLSSGYTIVRYYRIPMNMGAYLVTPEGARKFLLWKTLRTAPIDIDLKRFWEHRLDILALTPSPIVHNALGTSAIDTMEKRSRSWRPSRIMRCIDGFLRFVGFCHLEIAPNIRRKYPLSLAKT